MKGIFRTFPISKAYDKPNMPFPEDSNCWVNIEGKGLQPAYLRGSDVNGMTNIQWKVDGEEELVPTKDLVFTIGTQVGSGSNRRKMGKPKFLLNDTAWIKPTYKKAKVNPQPTSDLGKPRNPAVESSAWGTPSQISGSAQANHPASAWGTPSQVSNQISQVESSGWGTPSQISGSAHANLTASAWGTPSQISQGSSSSQGCSNNAPAAPRSNRVFLSQCANRVFADNPPQKRSKKEPPQEQAEYDGEEVPIEEVESNKEQYFLKFLWGDRLKIKMQLLSDPAEVPESYEDNNFSYQLVASKLVENKGKKSVFDTKKIKLYFVKKSGPGLKTIQVGKELEKLFNFPDKFVEKGPTKILSILELFVSPAMKGKFGSHTYNLKKSDFELIEEKNNMGCGFIPESFINKYLVPNMDKNQPCIAVQVRIFSPMLGVFKGMLMKKPNITKIQLPPSMMKAERSAISKRGKNDWAYFLVCGIYPSDKCCEMNKFLNPSIEKIPREDFLQGKQFKDILFPEGMFWALLKNNGVPEAVLEEYHSTCDEWGHREHYSVVGVADPTNEIPLDHLFLTGVGTIPARSMKSFNLFVTRFPCPQKKDCMVLKALLSKPPTMSSSSWQFLCNLPFGMLVFGKPKRGLPPIPERVGEGDLDGDLYVIMWSKDILSHIVSESDKNISVEKDDLVGSELTFNGKPAIICRKISGNYELQTGTGAELSTELVPVDEILKEYDFLEEILDHRKNEKGQIEIKIKWKLQQDPTWDVMIYRKMQFGSEIAEYARKNNLLEDKHWRWAKSQVFEAEMTGILDHREVKDGIQVEVIWQDGLTSWCSLDEIKEDATSFLVTYAKEKKLQDTHGWTWVKKHLKAMKNEWFEKVQELLSDVKQMREHDQLTTSLCGRYKKCLKNNEIENAEDFGKAFKESIDIRKHDGKVNLPIHLQLRLKKRSLEKYFDSY